MTIDQAENSGFIARMNQKDRVPTHDTKFYDGVKEVTTGIKESVPFYEAWLSGWDNANKEYAKVKTKK